MSTRHERNRPRAKGYPLSIWDSDAETNSTLDSDTYLQGSLLTRSATLGTKTNGIKCVSIEEPPRAQEKNQHFSAAENRNRRREKETMPSLHQTGPQPPGSRVLAASSQLSTLNSQLSTKYFDFKCRDSFHFRFTWIRLNRPCRQWYKKSD